MSCAVCFRDHRGPQFIDPAPEPGAPRQIYRACSMGHLDVIFAYWKANEMMDPTRNEEAALLVASDAAGEYLESIGKTDLATLDVPQWMGLVRLIFERATGEIGRLTDEMVSF